MRLTCRPLRAGSARSFEGSSFCPIIQDSASRGFGPRWSGSVLKSLSSVRSWVSALHLLLRVKIFDNWNPPARSVWVPNARMGLRGFRSTVGRWPHRPRGFGVPDCESALSFCKNVHCLLSYTVHPRRLTILLLRGFHVYRARRLVDYPLVQRRPETELSQEAACSENVLAKSDQLLVLTGGRGKRS